MINGNEMLDLIRTRQSDRSYSDRAVEKEKIDRITEAGRLAPSACNSQPWKLIVVDDRALLDKLARAASAKLTGMNSFVSQAPVQVVVVREKANMSSRIGATVKNKDYSRIDIGIVSENICLQARAEGLGSCMIGWFDERMVKKILKIPASKRVELLITIGYPARETREKKRRPSDDVISRNSY
ncbi:MAG: nitroreductase family protein [Bacteroidales bacterium]|jgi:nitroreductase